METAAAIVSALVAAIGLFATWQKARDAALRRTDVLNWANQVIEALQTLYLLSRAEISICSIQERDERITAIAIKTSVLTEQGRLFFKNTIGNDHGAHKKPAYRGYRPLILDHVVISYKAAMAWQGANTASRIGLRLVIEDCLKGFVSSMQKEVGRGRTADPDTREPGSGSDLAWHVASLGQDRIRRLTS